MKPVLIMEFILHFKGMQHKNKKIVHCKLIWVLVNRTSFLYILCIDMRTKSLCNHTLFCFLLHSFSLFFLTYTHVHISMYVCIFIHINKTCKNPMIYLWNIEIEVHIVNILVLTNNKHHTFSISQPCFLYSFVDNLQC